MTRHRPLAGAGDLPGRGPLAAGRHAPPALARGFRFVGDGSQAGKKRVRGRMVRQSPG
jgi:hypothetical protein